MEQRMDGQITSYFTSLLTVFQSYQDDGKVTMKHCVQWTPVKSSKGFTPRRKSKPGTARSD